MADSCCAYGCTNHREENGDRSFYRFPCEKNEEQQTRTLRKKWIQPCKRKLVRTTCDYECSCFLVIHSGRITFSNTLINLAFRSC